MQNYNSQLNEQIDSFVARLEEANRKRTVKRSNADHLFIRSFFDRITRNRNSRADEIDSPQYSEVLAITKRLLPYPVSLLRCMDGRAFGPLIGLFGKVGESITVAGGTINEFVRHEKTQQYYLLPDSNYAEHIRKALKQHSHQIHVEIMDSHLGCAAREAAEIARGRFPKDHGLFADVLKKQDMCEAVINYVHQKHKGKRDMLVMQISLDLHNGFMYMGLGKEKVIHECLQKYSYDDETLKTLVRKEKIISTKALAEDPKITSVFEKYHFPIDIVNNYGKSAYKLWSAVEAMYPLLKPVLQEKLYRVYPRFKEKGYPYEKELDERAVILLVNAFIGYLHKTCYKTYPFAQHEEEGIFMGKGTNTPYAIDMFDVSTIDMDTVPANVELSAALVRGNRNAKRVTAGQDFFDTTEQFVSAPVCVIMQVKVLDELSEEEWKWVSAVTWDGFEDIDWTTLSDQSFLDYLEDQAPDIPIAVVNAMNKLRHRLAFLYDIDRETFPFLMEQDIVILPVISDTSLRIRAIIPFLKTGYR